MKIQLVEIITLKVPLVPNCVRGLSYPAPNEIKEHVISVGDLTDDQIRQLGTSWTTALLNRANEIRVEKAREKEKQHAPLDT